MENNEIMTIEEVIGGTEEIAMASSGNSFKIVAGIGLTALGGFVAYKYVIKPVIAKIKAKKGQSVVCEVVEDDENEE